MEDKCLTHAGNLAYICILSLVPLLVVGASLFSAYGLSQEMKSSVVEMFLRHLLPSTAENVGDYIDSFISNSRTIGISGMVALIILSYSLFNAVEGVFQAIWSVKGDRSLIQKILIFTNVLFWTPLLMGMSVYLRTRLEFVYHANVFTEYAISTVAFLLPWVGFTAAYLIIPVAKVRLKSAALGGIVATVFWYLILHGFDLYVKYTQSMQTLSKLYGSLVIIPIFLIWIYFCWVVTFFGAEVAFYHQFPKFNSRETGEGDFFTVLAILIFVASEYEQGSGCVEEDEIVKRWPGSNGVLRKLIDLGILVEADEGYLLTKPSGMISVERLYQIFAPREGVGKVYEMFAKEVKGKTLRDCLG